MFIDVVSNSVPKMSTQTLIYFDEDEEEKFVEIIPDVIPKEKKPLVSPQQNDEIEDEEDYDDYKTIMLQRKK